MLCLDVLFFHIRFLVCLWHLPSTGTMDWMKIVLTIDKGEMGGPTAIIKQTNGQRLQETFDKIFKRYDNQVDVVVFTSAGNSSRATKRRRTSKAGNAEQQENDNGAAYSEAGMHTHTQTDNIMHMLEH